MTINEMEVLRLDRHRPIRPNYGREPDYLRARYLEVSAVLTDTGFPQRVICEVEEEVHRRSAGEPMVSMMIRLSIKGCHWRAP